MRPSFSISSKVSLAFAMSSALVNPCRVSISPYERLSRSICLACASPRARSLVNGGGALVLTAFTYECIPSGCVAFGMSCDALVTFRTTFSMFSDELDKVPHSSFASFSRASL